VFLLSPGADGDPGDLQILLFWKIAVTNSGILAAHKSGKNQGESEVFHSPTVIRLVQLQSPVSLAELLHTTGTLRIPTGRLPERCRTAVENSEC